MILCDGCNARKHKSLFHAEQLRRNELGWNAIKCRLCVADYRNHKRWLKDKTTFLIERPRKHLKPKKFRLFSAEYNMSVGRKSNINKEAIRSTYRLWCKTGVLKDYGKLIT